MPAEVVRIEDPTTGASAEVLVSLGFNCFSWKAPAAGELREMLWAEEGFAGGDLRPSRSGTPLLFPFAGRIKDGLFEFEGKEYEIEKTDGLGNAIHGYALRSPWRVVESAGDRVTAEFQPSVDDPDALGQWTGDYLLTATYALEGTRLVLDFSAKILSDSRMPYAFGTHAYFRIPLADGAEVEQTFVQAPVNALWESKDLIPTTEATEIGTDEPLPKGAPLDGREFDTPYRFSPGATETLLKDQENGVALRQTFDDSMTCCVIFTPGHREAICLEPYTSTPDPFNMQAAGVDSGLRVLEPGETYSTKITLEASSSS